MNLFQQNCQRLRDSSQERFWARVDIKGKDDCWFWKKRQIGDPYPILSCRLIQNTPIRAHRAAFYFQNGFLTPGKMVLHKCGNSYCCNPNHLYEGDWSDNRSDSERHGTAKLPPVTRGIKNHLAKLTDLQVLMIRQIYPTLKRGQKGAFAKMIGTNLKNCENIISNRTWRHLIKPGECNKFD